MNDECWMAFAVAILHPKEVTPEQAFDLLAFGPRNKSEEMARMHSAGLSYSEIGAEYGLTRWAIYQRIKRLQLHGILGEEVD